MKLMVIAPYFYPRIGGLENYAYNLSKFLINSYSIEVVVICSNWDDNSYKEELITGIKVFRLPYLFKVSSTPINPFWKGQIGAIIDKEKPDIINGHIPVPYIADVAARIAHKKGIPFILTYHNDLTGYNPVVRLLSKIYYYTIGFKTFELSQRIIVTSEYYAKNSPYLKGYHQKLRIVPPGVDVEKFNTTRTNHLKNRYRLKGEKIILFVGQLNKESQHKGLDYLMKAIKTVSDSMDVKLIIVGTGNYVEYYKSRAEFQGIANQVIFAGYVEENDLPGYYCESDVVVLPSYDRAEGFGMVLIEAQACGTPVIGTTVGGIPYAIKDGETGLLVPPKDSEKLAEAISMILCDETLAEKMGHDGYKRVRKKFTWGRIARMTEKIYREVVYGCAE